MCTHVSFIRFVLGYFSDEKWSSRENIRMYIHIIIIHPKKYNNYVNMYGSIVGPFPVDNTLLKSVKYVQVALVNFPIADTSLKSIKYNCTCTYVALIIMCMYMWLLCL